jgi:hypothetical protein
VEAVAGARLLEDQIRQRAYDLYEAGGRKDGHDVDDWLRAEAEIAGVNASPDNSA